jgi:hypothetical protein
MTENQTSDVSTVSGILGAASELGDWEISDVERISILQITPTEYMCRVEDRDGNVQGKPFNVSVPDAL